MVPPRPAVGAPRERVRQRLRLVWGCIYHVYHECRIIYILILKFVLHFLSPPPGCYSTFLPAPPGCASAYFGIGAPRERARQYLRLVRG